MERIENRTADTGYTGTAEDGALEGERVHTEFAERMTYGGYLQLDRVLAAQRPRRQIEKRRRAVAGMRRLGQHGIGTRSDPRIIR